MKITFSVLVAGASGKAGGTVASNWKGRPYVRTHVIPHNPKSDDQKTQRGFMARQAKWWRTIPAVVVDALDDYGTGIRLSGFNVMARANLKALAASLCPPLKPGNPHEPQVSSFSAGPSGITAKEIDVTWSRAQATQGDHCYFFTCPVDPAEALKEAADEWHHNPAENVLTEDEAATLECGFPDKDYYIAMLIGDAAAIGDTTTLSGGIATHAKTKGE